MNVTAGSCSTSRRYRASALCRAPRGKGASSRIGGGTTADIFVSIAACAERLSETHEHPFGLAVGEPAVVKRACRLSRPVSLPCGQATHSWRSSGNVPHEPIWPHRQRDATGPSASHRNLGSKHRAVMRNHRSSRP